jgi:hypothetical protein
MAGYDAMDLIEWVMANSQDILQSLRHRDWRSGPGDGDRDRQRERETDRQTDRDDVAGVMSGAWAEAGEAEAEAEAWRGTSSRVGVGGVIGGGGLSRTSPRMDAVIDGGRPVIEWREDWVTFYLSIFLSKARTG